MLSQRGCSPRACLTYVCPRMCACDAVSQAGIVTVKSTAGQASRVSSINGAGVCYVYTFVFYATLSLCLPTLIHPAVCHPAHPRSSFWRPCQCSD